MQSITTENLKPIRIKALFHVTYLEHSSIIKDSSSTNIICKDSLSPMALNGLASMVNPSLRLKDASINNTATKRLKLKVKLNLRNYHSPFSKINEYNAKIMQR